MLVRLSAPGIRCGSRNPESAITCGRIDEVSDDWTIERHLQDEPGHVVALYHRFIALAEACGPFDYAVARTAVSLKGSRRGFAGAVPTARALDGHLDLQRQVSDPRIRRSSPCTRRLFVHHFRVTSSDQLDDDFAGWIAEAYAVGQGAHLAAEPRRAGHPPD